MLKIPPKTRTELRVLLTAFEPYDSWEQNSSWEALITFLHHRGLPPGVTTRRYPVDLAELQSRLDKDLAKGYDAVLHLGQAPGISRVQMEAIAVNVAGMTEAMGDFFGPLVSNAPIAYRTNFPLDQWNLELSPIAFSESCFSSNLLPIIGIELLVMCIPVLPMLSI